jgi:hypothetical protein
MTEREVPRQTNRERETHPHRETYRKTDRQTEINTYREIEK